MRRSDGFYEDDSGHRFISVTHALDRAGLYDSAKAYFTQESRDVGTLAHALCCEIERRSPADYAEYIATTLEGPCGDLLKATNRALSWRRFIDMYQWVSSEMELEVVHPGMQYAGTLDRLGTFGGSPMPYVIDLKPPTVVPATAIQTAAYAAALELMEKAGAGEVRARGVRRGSVHLRDNGDVAKFIEHTDPNDFTVFQSALNLARWKEKTNG